MSNDVQKFSHRESTFGSRPNTLPAVLCDSFAQYSVLCQTLPNDMCCRPFRFPMDSSINSLQWFMIIMIYEFVTIGLRFINSKSYGKTTLLTWLQWQWVENVTFNFSAVGAYRRKSQTAGGEKHIQPLTNIPSQNVEEMWKFIWNYNYI